MAEEKIDAEPAGKPIGTSISGQIGDVSGRIGDVQSVRALSEDEEAARQRLLTRVGRSVDQMLVSEVIRPRYLAGGIVDATGTPMNVANSVELALSASAAPSENEYTNPRAEDFEYLSAKTTEVLTEAALAYERIVKDQEEIEQLKMETRALLTRLRAA